MGAFTYYVSRERGEGFVLVRIQVILLMVHNADKVEVGMYPMGIGPGGGPAGVVGSSRGTTGLFPIFKGSPWNCGDSGVRVASLLLTLCTPEG